MAYLPYFRNYWNKPNFYLSQIVKREGEHEKGVENREKYVRIINGKYKDCIGKIVYEYKHFKGFYLVKILYNPNEDIHEWNPSKEMVLTENSLLMISPEEINSIMSQLKEKEGNERQKISMEF